MLSADGATRARRGRLTLPHGTVETPAFMPVGTAATIKAMLPRDVRETGAEMVLANTYHLAIQPGETLVERLGGLHRFMGFSGPILTDSGGFQVFSLPGREVSEEGVRFRYEVSGERVLLTPERSMEIQQALGADVAMVFDECIPFPAERSYAAASVERTIRWAERCLAAHARAGQHLFGIVQGGVYEDLRARCARALSALPFSGLAIGGVSVGEGLENLKKVVGFTEPHLPAPRVRYLMGVGLPEDILESIERGMDIFDCIIPTRFGRGGTLFTTRGRIRIDSRRFRRDAFPIDPSCDCHACAGFTRAYLHHLFQARELLGVMLASIHNLRFYQRLMAGARRAIEERNYSAWKEQFLGAYLSNARK
ncbi:MAG: tRNA guanosine(34) transglycosylase Tgt [Planctomycetes bacterium]|nr:tRNA guanosine(34) transglycosylase Tgt [Planctomycetota bacterium]